MPSPHLVDAIDRLDPLPFQGEAFRHIAARWHPLSGAGARSQGGRWNPPESFSTVYLALSEKTAIEEFRRMARRSGRAPEDFVPRRIYRFRLNLQEILDLTGPSEVLGPLAGLDLQAEDLAPTQAVGEAAQYLGREAIMAPSATGVGNVLVVFIDRLRPDSLIESQDFKTWTAVP
jgi:RES domain-containing protein